MLRIARSLFTQLRPKTPLTRSERLKAVQDMSEAFKSIKRQRSRIRNMKDFFQTHQHSAEPPEPPRTSTIITYQHTYQVNEEFGWAEREEIPAEGRDYLVAESMYADLILGTQTRLQEDLGMQFGRRVPEEVEGDEVHYGGKTYWFKREKGEVHICTRAAGMEEVVFSLSELLNHPLLKADPKVTGALQGGYFPIVNIVAAQEGGLLALVLDFPHYDYG